MLSRFQNRKLKHLFRIYDCDGSGWIDRADAITLAERLGSALAARQEDQVLLRSVAEQRLRLFSRFADRDRDGRISENDWLDYYDLVLSDPVLFDCAVAAAVDSFIWAFQLVHSKLDDFADLARFQACLGAHGIAANESEATFRRLDANSDGVLTRAEMHKALAEFFGDETHSPGNLFFGAF